MWKHFCAAVIFVAAVTLAMSAFGGGVVFNQVTKDSVTATIQPDAADVGKSVNVWMGANLQGAWYVRNDSVWASYQGGPFPVAMRNVTLSASTPITVGKGMDVTGFSGMQIYVGYGANEQDMLTSPGKLTAFTPTLNFPVMRGASMEGNWGGNIFAATNIPDSYIQRLRDDNVSWVGIKITIFNAPITDPVVRVMYRPSNDANYANNYTFNDNDLINAVTKLRQQGFNVYLSLMFMQPRPGDLSACNTAQYAVHDHLFGDPALPTASNSSAWEYQCINPAYWWWNPSHPSHAANVATFWATYTQVAVKYAKLAQQLGVGMFALGEEGDRLFRTRSSARFPNHFRNELTQMVAAVRAEYTGLLTYGQQVFVYLDHPEWWGLDNTASASLFQDLELDAVGLSAYFTLVNSNPITRVYSVPEFEVAWTSVFQKYLVPLQARNPNTPIIFTDTGTSDTIDAPFLPSGNSAYVFTDANANGIDDGMEQQANIYQALFNVNRAFNYLIRGTTFFGFNIDTDPYVAAANNAMRSMELHGKPAEQVLRNEYGALKLQ